MTAYIIMIYLYSILWSLRRIIMFRWKLNDNFSFNSSWRIYNSSIIIIIIIIISTYYDHYHRLWYEMLWKKTMARVHRTSDKYEFILEIHRYMAFPVCVFVCLSLLSLLRGFALPILPWDKFHCGTFSGCLTAILFISNDSFWRKNR